jgi:hypothetical protein
MRSAASSSSSKRWTFRVALRGSWSTKKARGGRASDGTCSKAASRNSVFGVGAGRGHDERDRRLALDPGGGDHRRRGDRGVVRAPGRAHFDDVGDVAEPPPVVIVRDHVLDGG